MEDQTISKSQVDIHKELNSEEYKQEWNRLIDMRKSITYCLSFCYMNSVRDGISGEQNFFLRILDDTIQSIVSIEILAKEGILNTCRRELRYLIELSIKSCVIVNNNPKKSFELQIAEYEKLLSSSNINPINTLSFSYFDKVQQEDFKTEVKRLYGYLSKYTHASAHQIQERLTSAMNGRTIGFEGISELKALNKDVEKVLSVVVVMIFHSVAQYVVGDFMVKSDGKPVDWYFNQSKFINIIDESFDYKSERQAKLVELKKERLGRITF